jgi:hypothetical protein
VSIANDPLCSPVQRARLKRPVLRRRALPARELLSQEKWISKKETSRDTDDTGWFFAFHAYLLLLSELLSKVDLVLSRLTLSNRLKHIEIAHLLAGVGGGDKVVRGIRLQVADGCAMIGAAGIIRSIRRL